MDYQIIQLPQKIVAGKSIRTSNTDPQLQKKIMALWKEFLETICPALNNRLGLSTLGLYHQYESDVTGAYNFMVCCEVEDTAQLPLGAEKVEIPAGRYAKFTVVGKKEWAVAQGWREIWKTELDRSYQCDFEEYDPAKETISIYISIEQKEEKTVTHQEKSMKFCQSCGMPLTKEEDYGTNLDGKKNEEYCTYCYQGGKFVQECTMEEMIQFCAPICAHGNPYPDEATAVQEMRAFFPKLKRWQQKEQ